MWDSDGNPATVQHIAINASTNGDNTLVAAVSNKKIRVLQLFLLVDEDTDVQFKRGGTALTGVMKLYSNVTALISSNNGYILLPFSPVGWFEDTAINEAFIANLSGGDAQGCMAYIEV